MQNSVVQFGCLHGCSSEQQLQIQFNRPALWLFALIQHTGGFVLKEWSQNSLWLCQGLAFTLQSYKSIEAVEGRTHCKCLWRGRYGKCNYPEKEITRQAFFSRPFFSPLPISPLGEEYCCRNSQENKFWTFYNSSKPNAGIYLQTEIQRCQCEKTYYFSVHSEIILF